jgi:hypothetical protein
MLADRHDMQKTPLCMQKAPRNQCPANFTHFKAGEWLSHLRSWNIAFLFHKAKGCDKGELGNFVKRCLSFSRQEVCANVYIYKLITVRQQSEMFHAEH